MTNYYTSILYCAQICLFGHLGMVELEDEFVVDDIEQRPVIPLLSREDFLKTAIEDHDAIRDIRWAFHALGVEGLEPTDAPSPGAWHLYQSLKDDEVLQKSFYSTVYPKLLPSKAQMERGTDRAEDGRKLFGLIDDLLREPSDIAPVLSGAERRARELAISQASV